MAAGRLHRCEVPIALAPVVFFAILLLSLIALHLHAPSDVITVLRHAALTYIIIAGTCSLRVPV